MSGGEARRVTELKNGVDGFQWSPDGTRLAVLSRLGPSDSRPENKERSDVRHYSQQQYKFNDTGWFDDKRTHIWIVDVKTSKTVQLTSGDEWDDRDPQWSPDSTRIAFVSDRTGRAYEDSRNTAGVIPAAAGPARNFRALESDKLRAVARRQVLAFIGHKDETIPNSGSPPSAPVRVTLRRKTSP